MNAKTRRCEVCPSECASCVQHNSKVVCTSCPDEEFLDGNHCVKKCVGNSAAFTHYLRLSGNYSTFSQLAPRYGNSSTPYEGMLEARYNGEWSTVCDVTFDRRDARVFCRELGYGEPVYFKGGVYGRGSGKVIATGLACTGLEITFADCPQKPWFPRNSCTLHYRDVGIVCKPPITGYVVHKKCVSKCKRGMYRSPNNTCELCHRACATCKGSPENCTSCRESFYLNGTTCSRSCGSGYYANKNLRACQPCTRPCMTCDNIADNCTSCLVPFLAHDRRCVAACPSNMFRKDYTCVPDCGVKYYGNVTRSSKVCDACPVNCIKCQHEKSAVVCKLCTVGHVLTFEGICSDTCPPDQVVFPVDVKTFGIQSRIRLTNILGSPKFSGRLEVFHYGVWGSVCNNYWGFKSYYNAKIACTQLYLGPPVEYQPVSRVPKSVQDIPISKIWLDEIICHGKEAHIWDCYHSSWGSVDDCTHLDDVYLRCQSPGVAMCMQQCPDGYFKDGRICLPCHPSCVTCSNFSSNCLVCAKGYYKISSNMRTCVKDCPLGFYSSEKQCLVCDSSCVTCKGARICTSCRSPYFLFNNSCLSNCPEATQKRSGAKKIKFLKYYKDGVYEGAVEVSSCNIYNCIAFGILIWICQPPCRHKLKNSFSLCCC